MSRFKRKPEEVKAVRWTGENVAEVGALTEPDVPRMVGNTRTLLFGGDQAAVPGDYIIRDSDGALVALTAKTFEATYEPAATPTPPALDAARDRLKDLAQFHREEKQKALEATDPPRLDAAKINEAVAIAFEEILDLLPAAVPGPALDAEDRERLERIAADFEIAEREITTDSLGHGGAAFLRVLAERLASHQPESQQGEDTDDLCRCGHVRHEHHYYPDPECGPETGECSYCDCEKFTPEPQQEGRGERRYACPSHLPALRRELGLPERRPSDG